MSNLRSLKDANNQSIFLREYTYVRIESMNNGKVIQHGAI
jgi:hypothetical protein